MISYLGAEDLGEKDLTGGENLNGEAEGYGGGTGFKLFLPVGSARGTRKLR
jgi:hypothetical protein